MTQIVRPTNDNLLKAAHQLKVGKLTIFPTETVYGLGADALSELAVDRLYRCKGRPKNHPSIVHFSNFENIEFWAKDLPPYLENLTKFFWPGPLTLVLNKTKNVSEYITAKQSKVALRIPSHPTAIALLNKFLELGGRGVIAPSANKFGAVSPTSASAAEKELGQEIDDDELILDGGNCEIGLESTILLCEPEFAVIVRPGIITQSEIESRAKIEVKSQFKSALKLPGSRENHYQPNALVRISGTAEPGEGFIAMSQIDTPPGAIRLASPSNLRDFASNLYNAFRLGDELRILKISVVLAEGNQIADAINDRIYKAAAK